MSQVNANSFKDASGGKGDYIAAWEHPTLARPTPEQLEAL